MEGGVRLVAFIAALLAAGSAAAVDNVLLIQMQPGGQYRVWHNAGESQLSDDEIMALEAAATPEGSAEIPTGAGPASARLAGDGVIIGLARAATDGMLLIDHDGCGHVKLWHSAGTTNLTDDQLTDIVMSALPEGGRRISVGGYYVKAFLGKLGVTASLWRVRAKAK